MLPRLSVFTSPHQLDMFSLSLSTGWLRHVSDASTALPLRSQVDQTQPILLQIIDIQQVILRSSVAQGKPENSTIKSPTKVLLSDGIVLLPALLHPKLLHLQPQLKHAVISLKSYSVVPLLTGRSVRSAFSQLSTAFSWSIQCFFDDLR